MSSSPFSSYARNGEDVVLWRALGHVDEGSFLDIATMDERPFSTTQALRERGWLGITIDTGNEQALAAVLATPWPTAELHVLSIGDGSRAPQTIEELGAHHLRPWVVLAAATQAEPPSITGLGYTHCLFDGVSHFFFDARRPELARPLSFAACARDDYTTPALRELAARNVALESVLEKTTADAARWRASALQGWDARATLSAPVGTRAELLAMRRSFSWRITSPLRAVAHRLRPGLRP